MDVNCSIAVWVKNDWKLSKDLQAEISEDAPATINLAIPVAVTLLLCVELCTFGNTQATTAS